VGRWNSQHADQQTDGESATSGLSTLNKDQIAERGARLARRDDRAYREYVREEQRSQTGCPAREVVLDQRGQATSSKKLLAEHFRFVFSGFVFS